MRYALGARVMDSRGKIVEGVVATDTLGLDTILHKDNVDDKCYHTDTNFGLRILVFDNLEDATRAVRRYARCYRKEFRQRAKRLRGDVGEYRFYLLKVDTPKFPWKLGEQFRPKNIKEFEPNGKKYFLIR